VLACRAGRFLLRCNYDLGRRVIVGWISRRVVVAVPWPYTEKNLTIAEKMMPGEASKVTRSEMASKVRRVHAHTMAMDGRTRVEWQQEKQHHQNRCDSSRYLRFHSHFAGCLSLVNHTVDRLYDHFTWKPADKVSTDRDFSQSRTALRQYVAHSTRCNQRTLQRHRELKSHKQTLS
jgi:hypothetical protein